MIKSKFVVALVLSILIVGCFVPVVLAKSNTDSATAVGKGIVSYNDNDLKATIVMKGFVTPGGYTVEAEGGNSIVADGVAYIALTFVLPDGTKISSVRAVPFLLVEGNDGVLQGFKLLIEGQPVEIQIGIIKNKIVGYIAEEAFSVDTKVGSITVALDFILNFKIEIEGVDAGYF